MRKIVVIAILAGSLAGCASPQEMSQKECLALNMQPGTPAFANCYEQSMARRQSAINALIAN